MKIVRVQAVQAHEVPKRVYEPRGPFPAEIFDEPEIVYDYQSEDDEGGSSLPEGATAQNNFKPIKYYRCVYCHTRVADYEIDEHDCED
mgnify:CR=1 FL=1